MNLNMMNNSSKPWKKICTSALLSVAIAGAFAFGPAQQAAAAASAEASGNVYLRSTPSSGGKVVDKIYKGDDVSILAQSGDWYRIRTGDGTTGYASTKYIEAANTSVKGVSSSSSVEKVIQSGMKYLGTPYEYGSSRSTTTTFDCSDLMRQIFMEGADLKLPSDSRSQGAYIQEKGAAVYSTSQLKRGDLVFFMSYRGSSASAYAGVNKSSQRITHVAMYLGDGKLLHTYSSQAGGVMVDDFDGSWKYRFLFGGSPL
ncbi:NlpC/P60 family protein [Paenibacillus sp. JSM ZJ436]|uniref:NlpC/P60 family protein n=1 Tax=Paenibacillus algicola TaxID=2565926 RepID=A0A4P8XJ22_9BACL|nr:SH3 domain-containing C40 family peptidase [Paenibacillus algicola]QCT01331.1 NlpC/P60 family protein [Paenibacillus algicola]